MDKMKNWFRMTDAAQDAEIKKAEGRIDHLCDGPMTPFVAISRACHLSSTLVVHPEAVANALDAVLTRYGWLTDPDAKIVGDAKS